MGKSGIKKALKVAAWVVGCFLALDLLLVGLLFVPSIQTFVVHKVTESISEAWGTEISIGKIRLTPTLKLVAHEVAIKDHHNENMIYSEFVKGRLRSIRTKPFKLGLGDVHFDGVEIILRTYKGEETINIAQWARKFHSDSDKPAFELTSNAVKVSNGRFVLINDNTRVVYDTKGQPDIDYAFFELADIAIDAKDFKLEGADVAMKFKQLAFNQYGGFRIEKCSGDFRICDTTLTFNELRLKTPNSNLDLDLCFQYRDWQSYAEFLDSVNILAAIRPSTLSMTDIAGFAPAIKGMDEVFRLQADTVRGTVNDFRLRNVKARWLDDNLVQGDVAIRDVTRFREARFDVTLDSTVVNAAELPAFTLPKGKAIRPNKWLNKVGATTVTGTFLGGLSQFDAKLTAATGLGTVTTDVTADTQDGRMSFGGTLASNDLRLAKLTGNNQTFGATNLSLAFDGDIPATNLNAKSLRTAQAHVSGTVSRIPLLGYPVRNVRINGDYSEGLFNATLNANDPNLHGDLIAQLDISQPVPYLQGSMELQELAAGAIAQHLAPVDSAKATGIYKVVAALQRNPALKLSFNHFQISMSGNNLDNCNGFLGCDNLKLSFSEDSLSNERLRLTAINKERMHKYILSSNLVSATFESSYPIATVTDSLIAIAHNLFPSLIKAKGRQTGRDSEEFADNMSGYIKFNARTYNIRPITRLLYPDLFVASGSTVDLDIRADHVNDRAEINLPFFGIRNKVRLHHFHLDGHTSDAKTLTLQVKGDSAIVNVGKGKLLFDQATLNATAANDLIRYELLWHNPFNADSNVSQLSGSANIAKTDDIVVQLEPSRIFLKDYECHFNDQNTIHIRPHRYEIDNLVFSTNNSSLAFNGDYDTRDSSRLTMAAKNIDLSLFSPLFDNMSFDGRLSADLNLLNRNGQRLIFGKAITDELAMNETRLGDLFLMAGLNNENDIRFTGGLFNSSAGTLDYQYLSKFSIRDFRQEKNIITDLSGTYSNKRFDVKATFDSLQAGFLEPFLSSFSDTLSGKASGEIAFHASPDSSYLNGKVHVIDATVGIAALGTIYHVTDQDIILDKTGIRFPNMQLSDKDGNKAVLDGDIRHNMFRDMRLDLRINTDRILALNSPRTSNAVFYGTGYVKGDVAISGPSDNLSFSGPNIQTLKGSKIVLEVNSTNSASETSQIRFVPRTVSEEKAVNAPSSPSNLNFDFTFNVTNDADVVILIDAIGGTLNARADGRFQLVYNSGNDLNLYGNLLLHSGDFKLSLYDIVNSKFTLVNGGSINFDGPLENMTVNLSAYKTSKTSLTNIIPSDYLQSGNVDVNSYIHLRGPLMRRIEPTFSFELPNSSNEVRNLFYTSIDTQNTENITRQFAYFLVTNSFMPENMFNGSNGSTAGNSLNIFSNMVNNLLSDVIDSRRGGFGITYNQATETTSAEYGVKANANLFNERVSMSTRFGYYDDRSAQNAYNNIYGDLTVEYSINPAGTWKVKAFTYIGERDDNYNYLGDRYNNYVAGVALTYKQDFDSRKRRKPAASKRVKDKENKGGKHNEQ